MKPSDAVKAAAALSMLGLSVAVYSGAQRPEPSANRRYTRVAWDGGAPAQTQCLRMTGLTTPEVRALYRLDTDGGSQYVHALLCFPALGSEGAHPGMPPGMEALEFTEEVVDAGGTYQLEAWMAGEPGGFPCACSTGANCTWKREDGTSEPAPRGITLSEGQWSGSGCYPKTCVEFSGVSSWPDACPE